MLCGEDHIIKGTSVYVCNATPKQNKGYGPSNGPGGGPRNSGENYNTGGGWNGGPYNNAGNEWGGPQNNGGPMNNWNKQNPNMAGANMPPNISALTMPMLAALSQASMGLLGSMQQQQGGQDAGGYQGNQGSWQPQGNQGGGRWDNQGGNAGGRNERYNR
ncbi:hypothetical protein FHG87_009116 [Trinorchestia longiramus]|nr:hypothetical protein FHG87_009116 [Trinorchestia longiramus]